MNCANCYTDKHCKSNNDKHIPGCPTIDSNFLNQTNTAYKDAETKEFLLQSLRQVADGYDVSGGNKVPCKNRVEELVGFCSRMNYKKLGIAFCTGLEKEAKKLDEILRNAGFETVSAICKVGGICKEDVGLEEDSKIMSGSKEITCNPVGQAIVLNQNNTDFNIVVGLCLGHDSLFLKASEAPCTVLVVKDRVLKHNPALALQ